jgi:DNA invertase Pin-like site-specific DNA recombinase
MSENHSTNGNGTIRAAAYYRMSDDKQENSIERQRSQVEPYARRKGYQVVAEYTDEGIAGDEIARRKDFQRMLRDAQAGAFKVIVTDDKDRFGRFDSIDLGEVVAPLRRKGICLDAVAQGVIDWNSFAGRITDAVLQEAKNLELDAISRRVLSGQLLKAQKGIDTGGRALYGYRWEMDAAGNKRRVPDGRKADVVRLIFELYDRGYTLFAIATELHKRGVPSPWGRPRWTRSVLQRTLTNRRYVGDWTWGVQPRGKRHRHDKGGLRQTVRGEKGPRKAPAEVWVVLPNAHEPLIDRETFERVQARLKGNQTNTTPHSGGGNFALSKLLVCGHCGSALVGVTEYGRRKYVCRGYLAHGKSYCNKNWIAEKALVNALIRKLQEAFLDPENLQRLRDEVAAVEKRQRSDENLNRLKREIQKLTQQIDQGNERLAILPTDRLPGLIAKLREWEAARAAAQEELRRAETASAVDDLEKRIKAAEAALWQLQDAIRADDAPLLRELFREMIDRAELRWEHRRVPHRRYGTVNKATFAGGVVSLRASPEQLLLSPSAGRWRRWNGCCRRFVTSGDAGTRSTSNHPAAGALPGLFEGPEHGRLLDVFLMPVHDLLDDAAVIQGGPDGLQEPLLVPRRCLGGPQLEQDHVHQDVSPDLGLGQECLGGQFFVLHQGLLERPLRPGDALGVSHEVIFQGGVGGLGALIFSVDEPDHSVLGLWGQVNAPQPIPLLLVVRDSLVSLLHDDLGNLHVISVRGVVGHQAHDRSLLGRHVPHGNLRGFRAWAERYLVQPDGVGALGDIRDSIPPIAVGNLAVNRRTAVAGDQGDEHAGDAFIRAPDYHQAGDIGSAGRGGPDEQKGYAQGVKPAAHKSFHDNTSFHREGW